MNFLPSWASDLLDGSTILALVIFCWKLRGWLVSIYDSVTASANAIARIESRLLAGDVTLKNHEVRITAVETRLEERAR